MAYVLVFVKEKDKTRLGGVALELMDAGLDEVLVFDDIGAIAGKCDGWIADAFLQGQVEIDAVDHVDVCSHPIIKGNTGSRDEYWRVVRECLVRFLGKPETEADALVKDRKEKLYHNSMLYHDDAFNVACNLAGLDREQEEKVQQERWAEYLKLVE